MDVRFRKASGGDIPAILDIIADARTFMASSGVCQWTPAYPARGHIEADVTAGTGHVLTDGELILAYGNIGYDGDPAYGSLEGQWLSRQPYVVLHRLAVSAQARGLGLGRLFLRCVEEHALNRGIKSFKVDTSESNAAMRHLLTTSGFTLCGFIAFRELRLLGFEKVLSS